MPRHAPELECSVEDKASLLAITKSRTEEARAVERAKIVLACLEGKEIQQVAQALRIVGTERTAGFGAAGKTDHLRCRLSQPSTCPAGGTTASRHVALGRPGGGGETRRQRSCRLARSAPRRNLSAAAA